MSPTVAAKRWLFLAGILLCSATLAWQAGRVGLADHGFRSLTLEGWRRAAEVEPDNAQYWYALGTFRQSDFENPDVQEPIRHFERATQLNPPSATYWMALATAYEMSGDVNRARDAFAKARARYPISAEVAWRYGNFLFRQERSSEGLAEIRRALAGDSSLAPLAVSLCWRASRDVERILQEVLPPQQRFYLQALDYFLSQKDLDPALAVWNRLLSLQQPLELPRAFPLVEELMRQKRLTEAKQVWHQALSAAGWEPDVTAQGSLVTDGSFEHALPNAGFGWRQQHLAGVSVEFDASTYHGGTRSLRLTFAGTANLDFHHLTQYVPVEPRTRYRFTAFLRAEALSTDSGIRFRLVDLHRSAALDILTAALLGTEPWSRQEVEFTTGPETRLLGIAFRRLPSRKLDNKIRGTVWADTVSLTPLLRTPPRPSP